jgi:hypothetical protein
LATIDAKRLTTAEGWRQMYALLRTAERAQNWTQVSKHFDDYGNISMFDCL